MKKAVTRSWPVDIMIYYEDHMASIYGVQQFLAQWVSKYRQQIDVWIF